MWWYFTEIINMKDYGVGHMLKLHYSSEVCMTYKKINI